jgi:hypothetical protein
MPLAQTRFYNIEQIRHAREWQRHEARDELLRQLADDFFPFDLRSLTKETKAQIYAPDFFQSPVFGELSVVIVSRYLL